MSNIKTCISYIEKQNIGTIVTYKEIVKQLSNIDEQKTTIRKSFSRLVEKGMVKRVDNGTYKILSNKRFRIFVYGSLKRKCINHGVIKNNATFISTAIAIKKYAMFKAEYGNFPRLMTTNSKYAKHIHGEVYDVYSEDALRQLDQFEGLQYNRMKIKVKMASGEIETVYAYINESEYVPRNVILLDRWKDRKPVINKREILRKLNEKIEQQKMMLHEA